jgi:hypothetical protein
MKRKNWLLGLGMAISLLPAAPAIAADHRDGAAVDTDPSTDINDVYAWVDAGGQSVYLAMTVFPAAAKTSLFSNQAYYVFHTTSRANAAGAATPLDITCSFDNAASQNISCWIGDSTNFVYGNASSPTGLVSGNTTIFAGPRKDHFFFNLAGYNQVRANVTAAVAAKQITFNTEGCPTAPLLTLQNQAIQLGQSPTGGAAQDFFLPLNTLSIVLKLPVTTVNKGGPLFSVWAGTYRKG